MSFDFTTDGMVEQLALMRQGLMEPEVWSANENMSVPERIEHCKEEVLDRVRDHITYSASTFDTYRKKTSEELKFAKRRYQKSIEKIPPDLQEPVFKLWISFLEDAVAEIEEELNNRGVENQNQNQKKSESEILRDSLRKTVEMISNLESDRDEEISKNPANADLIKKIYRQAIDRIREQQ